MNNAGARRGLCSRCCAKRDAHREGLVRLQADVGADARGHGALRRVARLQQVQVRPPPAPLALRQITQTLTLIAQAPWGATSRIFSKQTSSAYRAAVAAVQAVLSRQATRRFGPSGIGGPAQNLMYKLWFNQTTLNAVDQHWVQCEPTAEVKAGLLRGAQTCVRQQRTSVGLAGSCSASDTASSSSTAPVMLCEPVLGGTDGSGGSVVSVTWVATSAVVRTLTS